MSSSSINGDAADGTVETHGGSHILRLERHLPHPIKRVWVAISEPEQLVTWLAEVELAHPSQFPRGGSRGSGG